MGFSRTHHPNSPAAAMVPLGDDRHTAARNQRGTTALDANGFRLAVAPAGRAWHGSSTWSFRDNWPSPSRVRCAPRPSG